MLHCFFEQSGTFKNAYIKLGGKAKDYDIANDYGQTDKQIDLFDQIERAYLGLNSIFNTIKPSKDLIIAFFPCTEFNQSKHLLINGMAAQLKNSSELTKLNYDLLYHAKLHRNFEIISKLAIVCHRGGYSLIIENPATQPHYLTAHWCVRPGFIDKDRSAHGDYYKKPTQFFFVNFKGANNEVEMTFKPVEKRIVNHMRGADRQTKRSEIHPQYAEWFIKKFIAVKNGDRYEVK